MDVGGDAGGLRQRPRGPRSKGFQMTVQARTGTPNINHLVKQHRWEDFCKQYMAGVERGDTEHEIADKLYKANVTGKVLSGALMLDVAKQLASNGRGNVNFQRWMADRLDTEGSKAVPIRDHVPAAIFAEQLRVANLRIADLEGKLASRKQEDHAKIAGDAAENTRLADAERANRKEINDLKTKLSEAKSEAAEARAAQDEMANARGTRESEVTSLRRQREELRTAVTAHLARIDELEADLERSRAARTRLEADLAKERREGKEVNEKLRLASRPAMPTPKPVKREPLPPPPPAVHDMGDKEHVYDMIRAGILTPREALELLKAAE